MIVGSGMKTGIKIRQDNPKAVGADRIVNLVAAKELYGGPAIVIDYGTANTFDVSMIPWFTFTSFNLNIFGDGRYLLPIFTMGKWVEQNGRRMLPLAIQVHHAVCDGYHVGQFVECLQTMIDRFGGNKEMFSTRKDNPRT